MKVILTTIGSTGDIQPFVALAMELRRRGHQSLFALPSPLVAYPQKYGFPVIQLGQDISDPAQHLQRLFSQGQVAKNDSTAKEYFEVFFASAPQALAQLKEVCETADLLISSDVMPLGLMVHELITIPFVSLRTRYTPLPYTGRTQPKNYAANHAWKNLVDLFRTECGLSPIDDPIEPYGISPQLTLFPVSRAFLPPDTRFPEQYYVTGFFFQDEDEWEPDRNLVDFLQAGCPPVVISLGSMVHDDPKKLTHLFLEAIQAVGCRAVIQHGWSGLAQDIELPDTVYAIDFVPHSWLFPQAACVIHHGGLGTTAAVSKASVPSIVIIHVFDNAALARSTQKIGATSAALSLATLNVDQLTTALSAIFQDSQYQIAATFLGKLTQAEQGVQTACQLIEQIMAKYYS